MSITVGDTSQLGDGRESVNDCWLRSRICRSQWVKRQPIRYDYCSAVVTLRRVGMQWRNQLTPGRPDDEINLRLVINQYGWIYRQQQMQSAIGY